MAIVAILIWIVRVLFGEGEWYHAKDKGSNDLHKHEELTFKYPTVGIPIPGNTYNFTKVAEKDLAKFD